MSQDLSTGQIRRLTKSAVGVLCVFTSLQIPIFGLVMRLYHTGSHQSTVCLLFILCENFQCWKKGTRERRGDAFLRKLLLARALAIDP